MDLEEVMEYERKTVDFLKEDEDIVNFKLILRQSVALLTRCENDFKETKRSIEEYEGRVDSCDRMITRIEPESESDKEVGMLEMDLEHQKQLEKTLRKELRQTIYEIQDLKRQTESVEERNQTLKKVDRDELKLENKLSMHASVTKVIPNMEDPSIISGYIVDRHKKDAKKFDVDSQQMSSFDACDYIWKLINSSSP